MRRDERLERIKATVMKLGNASTNYLSKSLDVSEPTIRRDITYLCNLNQSMKKIHGGIVYEGNDQLEYMFELKQNQYIHRKRAIAQKLIDLIDDNDTIALDSGSTCYYASMELHHRDGLTVICTDIKTAEELCRYDNIETIIGGGIVRAGYYAIGGSMLLDNLNQFYVNKAIIAADALSLSKGITNSSTFEVGIKKKLLEISETHILLTDSSKFNKSCLYKVADWSSIHTIITDEGITDETAQALESMGIKLYVV